MEVAVDDNLGHLDRGTPREVEEEEEEKKNTQISFQRRPNTTVTSGT